MKNLNEKIYTLFLLLSLLSCRPEQKAAEFSLTKNPAIVDGFHFETMMNNPVEVQYQIDTSEDANLTVQIILITKPKFGELTACKNQDGLWKCIYIPKQDFIGDDFLEFQTKDGDFLSDKLAKVTIKVLQFNYLAVEKKIQVLSKGSTLCDPLSGGEAGEAGKGLTGNIRLLNDSDNTAIRNNLNSYLDELLSYQVPNLSLFMSQVEVPTRSFDLGFTTQDNQVLSVDGKPLIEYFNVNLQSTLKITDELKAGEYELAIISDDGSRLLYKPNGQNEYRTYLESPSTHAPKMLCGIRNNDGTMRFMNFEKDKGVDIKINYFQGPMYHIALRLLWRKKEQALVPSTLCGSGINDNNFGTLTMENWEIVPPENFYLPVGVVNTCDEANDELSLVSFSVPVPKDKNLVGLLKNIRVQIKNLSNNTFTELTKDEYIISNGQIEDGEVLYEIEFSSAIVRDVDKEIIIQFDQRAI